MRKISTIIAVFAIATSACGNKNNQASSSISGKTESPNTTFVANNDVKGGTIHLTKTMFISQVWDYQASPQEWKYQGDKPAIVDFYANWCGPCKIAAPILEEISNEYAGKINVYKIDTQKEQELASVFGIQSIPAFLYIPLKGKPVMMAGIGRSKEETRQMFIENIGKYLLITK